MILHRDVKLRHATNVVQEKLREDVELPARHGAEQRLSVEPQLAERRCRTRWPLAANCGGGGGGGSDGDDFLGRGT